MPNRHGDNGESAKYGFQGQENDDEIRGKGNSVNYRYRMHDSRIGRFFAVDPLTAKYPHYTPYSFSGNKVIAHVELEGLEEIEYNVTFNSDGKAVFEKINETDHWYVFDHVTYNFPDLGNISYTFSGWLGGRNNAGFMEDFKKDPVSGILSGLYRTDGDIVNPKEMAKDLLIGLAMRKAYKAPRKGSKPPWLQKIHEGIKFQNKKISQLKKNQRDFQEQVRLVPQNGKGNVKGNRTDTDALIRDSDGKGGYTYSINEYKLSKKTNLTKGQKASETNVNSGTGQFEVRSDIPEWGLKKGNIITVKSYKVETKN